MELAVFDSWVSQEPVEAKVLMDPSGWLARCFHDAKRYFALF